MSPVSVGIKRFIQVDVFAVFQRLDDRGVVDGRPMRILPAPSPGWPPKRGGACEVLLAIQFVTGRASPTSSGGSLASPLVHPSSSPSWYTAIKPGNVQNLAAGAEGAQRAADGDVTLVVSNLAGVI